MLIRSATADDVSAIVAMLANDKLGQIREDYREPLPDSYLKAFARIAADSNQHLVVLENEEQVIGTLQLTFIPYLTYQGGVRAQIEAVRIHADFRGQGLGERLFRWAIEQAESTGAHVVQLTTDKKRPEAVRFYEKLGFKASHEGMKLHLLHFK